MASLSRCLLCIASRGLANAHKLQGCMRTASAAISTAQSQSYYDTLGLQRDASLKQIKEGFLKKSMEHHPDMNDSNQESHDEFLKVMKAYKVLSRPHAREEYDKVATGGVYVAPDLRDMYPNMTLDQMISEMQKEAREESDNTRTSGLLIRSVTKFGLLAVVLTVLGLGVIFRETTVDWTAARSKSSMDEVNKLLVAREKARVEGNAELVKQLDAQLMVKEVQLGLIRKEQAPSSGQ